MKFQFFILSFLSIAHHALAQRQLQACKQAVENLRNQEYMQHGTVAISIRNTTNGEIVYASQGELGLPAASTQKVITAICAYEILGQNHTFKTQFYFDSKDSTLFIKPSYDPTLGSWRYGSTEAQDILDKLHGKILATKGKVNKICIISPESITNSINDAWIVEDIGNYYGANCTPLIWRENQYDIHLTKKNNQVVISHTTPPFVQKYNSIGNTVVSSGGTSKISCYKIPGTAKETIIAGNLNTSESTYTQGAAIDGSDFFTQHYAAVSKQKIPKVILQSKNTSCCQGTPLLTVSSVSLDSINYYFLRKSINIYGESLLRSIAQKQYNSSNYHYGINAIRKFAHSIDVDSNAIHVFDGCGLSPQNRITANALSKFLQYAKQRPYFDKFYAGLPIINDINMKSGSIHGVRAYAGYINSSDGNIYSFAIIANNYTCSGKQMQEALWQVLNTLK